MSLGEGILGMSREGGEREEREENDMKFGDGP